MPALVLFNTRTNIAGDDLFHQSFLLFFVRTLQIIAVIIISVWVHSKRDPSRPSFDKNVPGCTERASFRSFWIVYYIQAVTLLLMVTCIVVLIGTIIEVMTMVISRRGTPIESEKRKNLTPILQFKIITFPALRLISIVLGCLSLYSAKRFYSCYGIAGDPTTEQWYLWLKILVLSEVTLMALFTLKMIGFFLKHAICKQRDKERGYEYYKTALRQVCKCCSFWTCTLFGGRHIDDDDLMQISVALREFFVDELNVDIVSSDIRAGFLMLLRTQRQAKYEVCNSIKKSCVDEQTSGWAKYIEIIGDELESESSSSVSSLPPTFSQSGDLSIESGPSDRRMSQDQTNKLAFMASNELMMMRSESLRKIPSTYLHFKRNNDSETRYRAQIRNVIFPSYGYDRLVIAEGARYMRFANAIYTWMVYTVSKPCNAMCNLTCANYCRWAYSCSKSKRNYSKGEMCCGWHKIALRKQSGLSESEIAYAHFEQGVKESPYCIAIDHDWKTIVLVIRGTLCLDDVVADLKVRPVDLEELGIEHGFDGRNEYAHSGMLGRSKWIYEDLKRHGTLNKLLLGDLALYPNYRLRIVGHSLGAGCATILSLMLRSTFPGLRCLAFAPPGCVVSKKTAIKSQDFVISYVLNTDIVPRLSLESLVMLKNELLELITRIKVPKHQVISTYIKEMYSIDIKESNEKLLHSKDNIPDTAYSRTVRDYIDARVESMLVKGKYSKLYPPGKIVHFARTQNSKSLSQKLIDFFSCGMLNYENFEYKYTPRWANNSDFDEVLISSTMLYDHFPFNMVEKFEECAKFYGMEPPLFLPFEDENVEEENI